MRKTLQDVASYLKEIMVPETHEAYAINPAYTNVSVEESIRDGVQSIFGSSLRCFIHQRKLTMNLSFYWRIEK